MQSSLGSQYPSLARLTLSITYPGTKIQTETPQAIHRLVHRDRERLLIGLPAFSHRQTTTLGSRRPPPLAVSLLVGAKLDAKWALFHPRSHARRREGPRQRRDHPA